MTFLLSGDGWNNIQGGQHQMNCDVILLWKPIELQRFKKNLNEKLLNDLILSGYGYESHMNGNNKTN